MKNSQLCISVLIIFYLLGRYDVVGIYKIDTTSSKTYMKINVLSGTVTACGVMNEKGTVTKCQTLTEEPLNNKGQ